VCFVNLLENSKVDNLGTTTALKSVLLNYENPLHELTSPLARYAENSNKISRV